MQYKVKLFLKNFWENTKESFGLFFESLLTLLRIFLESHFRTSLPKAPSKECFIVGNGPSLKDSINEHEELFKTSTLICVNSFPTTPEFGKLKPEFCVFLDPQFYTPSKENLLPHVKDAIDKLEENTKWPLTLLLPYPAKKADYIVALEKNNPNIRIAYFNYTIVRSYRFLRNYLFRKNLGMPSSYNVLGACIFLALNIGFKKVYLFGADHTFGQNLYVDEQNQVCMIHKHFYSDGKPLITPIYTNSLKTEKMNIAQYYELCMKTFQVYYILENYSRLLGAKIFNATPGSYIDAFEKKLPTE